MKMNFSTMNEATCFAEFLFEASPFAIFLVDKNVKIRLINTVYKTLFCTTEVDVLKKTCGNGFGCSFAVEAKCECGTMEECTTCSLRRCIVNALNDQNEEYRTTLERVCYIKESPSFKYFDIRVKQVTYNGEIMAAIIIDDVMDVNID